MTRDYLAEFEVSLVGHGCAVSRREYEASPGRHDWDFVLTDRVGFSSTDDPWRIVVDGRIALASADDGQRFGLKLPMDCEALARQLLDGKRIVRATVDRQTGDLSLQFDRATRLDLFRNSAGYEGWRAWYVIDGQDWDAIAVGGGEVDFVPPPGFKLLHPIDT